MHDDLITFPTWCKYIVISCYVEALGVREKRQIFQIIRRAPYLTHDTLFPYFGITAGEFSVWQVLSDHRKHKRSTKKSNAANATPPTHVASATFITGLQ